MVIEYWNIFGQKRVNGKRNMYFGRGNNRGFNIRDGNIVKKDPKTSIKDLMDINEVKIQLTSVGSNII